MDREKTGSPESPVSFAFAGTGVDPDPGENRLETTRAMFFSAPVYRVNDCIRIIQRLLPLLATGIPEQWEYVLEPRNGGKSYILCYVRIADATVVFAFVAIFVGQ